jgi:hypothetical protein
MAMARVHSPGYPNMALPKAITAVRKIFDADRRNPIDRGVAAKHIGYSGPSGAADKALASLAHYGLVEKAGKGELRVTQLAMDILHPDKPQDRKKALVEAGLAPAIFAELRERFGSHFSEGALESYLLRANFQNVAIRPVIRSFMETCSYLEQEKAFESGGESDESSADSSAPKQSDGVVFGGAKVGDLIQWESGGALQMEKPMRVRFVSDDGLWVAVEGSETGIPMSEVIVEERAPAPPAAPPTFKIPLVEAREEKERPGETEWMRNKVGKATTVALFVSGGEMGAKEIGKLITLLEAQRAVLADEDDDDG